WRRRRWSPPPAWRRPPRAASGGARPWRRSVAARAAAAHRAAGRARRIAVGTHGLLRAGTPVGRGLVRPAGKPVPVGVGRGQHVHALVPEMLAVQLGRHEAGRRGRMRHGDLYACAAARIARLTAVRATWTL